MFVTSPLLSPWWPDEVPPLVAPPSARPPCGPRSTQSDFEAAETLRWLCAKKGKKLHIIQQFFSANEADFSTPLCSSTAFVHGWELGLGAATARASALPWCSEEDPMAIFQDDEKPTA